MSEAKTKKNIKKWDSEHPDKMKEYKRNWAKKNRERIGIYQREYIKNRKAFLELAAIDVMCILSQ